MFKKRALPFALFLAFMTQASAAEESTNTAAAAKQKEYEDAKALYMAEKEMYIARTDMLKAKFASEVKGSQTGSVNAESDGAGAEARLLSVLAMKELASRFATTLAAEFPEKKKDSDPDYRGTGVVVMADAPGLDAAYTYEARVGGLAREVAVLKAADPDATFSASVAGTALALDAVSRLLGFFKTDYDFKKVTLNPDTAGWQNALIGALRQNHITVYLPAMRNAATEASLATELLEKPYSLQAETSLRVLKRSAAVAEIVKEISVLEKAMTQASPSGKKDLETKIKAKKERMAEIEVYKAAWTALNAAATELIVDLVKPSSAGKVLLVDVVNQCALKSLISDKGCGDTAGTARPILVTSVTATVGNSYIKKNMWSSLGGNPFYVMGGVTATATLVDSKGTVKVSLADGFHGGYGSVSDVACRINKNVDNECANGKAL